MNPEAFLVEDRKSLLREIKHDFNQKLGKYTHKLSGADFYFRSLGFSNTNIGYVFGFNVGFFRTTNTGVLDNAGMNVVVRLNGAQPGLRQKYADFFREHLRHWVTTKEYTYAQSQRDGSGIILPAYLPISQAQDQEEIIAFIKRAIDGLQQLYPIIAQNPGNLFDSIVRAAPFWHEDIIMHCEQYAPTR